MYEQKELYDGYISNNEELVVNKVLLTLLICAFILGVSIFGAYILARPLFEVDSLGDRWMGIGIAIKIVQRK